MLSQLFQRRLRCVARDDQDFERPLERCRGRRDDGRVPGHHGLHLFGADDPIADPQGEREPAADAELAVRIEEADVAGAEPPLGVEGRRIVVEEVPGEHGRPRDADLTRLAGGAGHAGLADDLDRKSRRRDAHGSCPARARHGLAGPEAGRLRHAVSGTHEDAALALDTVGAGGVQRPSAAQQHPQGGRFTVASRQRHQRAREQRQRGSQPRRFPQRVSPGRVVDRLGADGEGVQSAAHETENLGRRQSDRHPVFARNLAPGLEREGRRRQVAVGERYGAAGTRASRGVEDRRTHGRAQGGQPRVALRAQGRGSPGRMGDGAAAAETRGEELRHEGDRVGGLERHESAGGGKLLGAAIDALGERRIGDRAAPRRKGPRLRAPARRLADALEEDHCGR